MHSFIWRKSRSFHLKKSQLNSSGEIPTQILTHFHLKKSTVNSSGEIPVYFIWRNPYIFHLEKLLFNSSGEISTNLIWRISHTFNLKLLLYSSWKIMTEFTFLFLEKSWLNSPCKFPISSWENLQSVHLEKFPLILSVKIPSDFILRNSHSVHLEKFLFHLEKILTKFISRNFSSFRLQKFPLISPGDVSTHFILRNSDYLQKLPLNSPWKIPTQFHKGNYQSFYLEKFLQISTGDIPTRFGGIPTQLIWRN